MQPVSRRVRTIYSVIASSNRLEILRILNTKGPLSYSELKTLAGFKSKKESGKFAYHLRKLVRQMLIALNRQERKYTVTSLGRLVLNVTRQIEEQSVVESGKLYVRTSRQTMEEFNSDKILQSLVREAGMPVELAQRVTSETEARLYKFQTIYLTAPLIREMVNALLVEHGLEEYRHKLTRLGLPIYDISEMVNNTGFGEGDVGTVLSKTANAVFSEYLMLSQLPRDVTDAHLAGEIHISNGGSWGLMPDTVFFDLEALRINGINLKGKLSAIPKIEPPTKLDEALSTLVNITAILSKEVSSEISLENFTSYLAEFAQDKTKHELKETVKRALMLLPAITIGGHGIPIISLQVGKDNSSSKFDEALIKRVLESTFLAYEEYVKSVPEPMVNLVFTTDSEIEPKLKSMLSSAIYSGGKIGISNNMNGAIAYSGLRRDREKRFPADNVKILHSLAINLPRLSYESNRDETYFRAKLTMAIQTSISALHTRKKIISNLSRKNLLPALTNGTTMVEEEYVPLIVNLTGLNEAIIKLLGERATMSDKRSLLEKILETSSKSAADISVKLNENAFVAIIQGDSGERFASMDIEKYGRSLISIPSGKSRYSQTPIVTHSELSKIDYLRNLHKSYESLSGGSTIEIEIPTGGSIEMLSEIIGKAQKNTGFYHLWHKMAVCRACGDKFPEGTEKCDSCKSTSMKLYSTI
ncbi:MAG TPA: anaerobic ribonucleoside-triphosphate reductase [Nitrososphaerales archaeon]|jgi:ribonucleoside-triphosphate reductase|nr:anaerobic ribonucleoside-triphosphate reductase [Nitrososphaerales archaeon]|tara:strand:+ start:394 stop:2493 length:2100 start_codon:yes stop_codon:yes gene_type:complete